MIVTDETMALAQSIDDYFVVHPERHDQTHWVTVDGWIGTISERLVETNVCNTTMCIAGSAVFLSRPLDEFLGFVSAGRSWVAEGGDLLGLDSNETDWLFFDTNNETAIDAIRAIANGDVAKFQSMMTSSDA